MFRYVLIISFLFPLFLSAQVKNAGLVMLQVDSLQFSKDYCCVLSPAEGFSVYDKPNGAVIGKLKRDKAVNDLDQSQYQIFLNKRKLKSEVTNIHQIGYEIYALKYTDSVAGYIQVIDPNASYWLRVSEIKKQGFVTIKWMDYLVQNTNNVLGYYANDPGLRLRSGPGVEYDIIGGVKGDLFEIKLSNNIVGQWCKVKVKKYREMNPCETSLTEAENLEYETEGWIKVIDDNGEPNLYNYARGC